MVNRAIPHSDAWFAALEKFNPTQAAHSRYIVKAAGSTSVCSVCGDTPTTDFEVVGPSIEPDAPVIFRLCDDCYGIRAAAGGRKKLVLLCRSGVRSIAAAKRATELGAEAYNILEGFEGNTDDQGHRGLIGGWRKRGLPWKQN